MVTALAVRWLCTALFAAAGLRAALSLRAPARSARRADGASAAFSSSVCAALIVMTWRSEPATVMTLQAVLFAGAALWFPLARLIGAGRVEQPGLPVLLQTVMAGAMTWMLIAMPAGTAMPSAGRVGGVAMPQARAHMSGPALGVNMLLAVACAGACLPRVAQAIGAGRRVKDPVSAGHAAMSAGMAAMLFATS